MNAASQEQLADAFPQDDLQDFIFEEVPYLAPEDRDEAPFPQTYGATWTVTGLVRRTPIGGRCSDMVPFTRAIFRLTARDAKSGTLSIRLETKDKLGNYPGEVVIDLSRDVRFALGATTLLSRPGTDTKAWFRGADLAGTPRMDVAVSATYTTRRNGQICWAGTNSFRRTINLVRLAGFDSAAVIELQS